MPALHGFPLCLRNSFVYLPFCDEEERVYKNSSAHFTELIYDLVFSSEGSLKIINAFYC